MQEKGADKERVEDENLRVDKVKVFKMRKSASWKWKSLHNIEIK